MGIFQTKCKECKTKNDVQVCPFCKKYVCSKCLSYLVFQEKIPEWFIGKKVKNFEEYMELYLEYCRLNKEKGCSIHCCDKYLKDAWTEIKKQVKKMTKDTKIKAGYIIFK